MNDPLKANLSQKRDLIGDDFDEVERLLNAEETASIPSYIDRQIMAAAEREFRLPAKIKKYQYGFWRKLSLPIYVATGFVFTAFAFNSLWQEPHYQTDFEQASPTQIIIDGKSIGSEPEVEKQSLIKRELPTLAVAPERPKRTEKQRDNLPIDLAGPIEQSVDGTVNQKIYTGIHLSKAEYPEKEAWARKIIDKMREGDMDRARTELIRFKKVYPNYPIEEQIKSFSY